MDFPKAASAATQSQSSQNLNNPSEVRTSAKLGPANTLRGLLLAVAARK